MTKKQLLSLIAHLLTDREANGIKSVSFVDNEIIVDTTDGQFWCLDESSITDPDKDVGYTYRYEKADGTPLTHCPDCNNSLIDFNLGVKIDLSDGKRNWEEDSVLDALGNLVDTEDGDVAAGRHSSTMCGGCYQQLIDMEGVEEISNL